MGSQFCIGTSGFDATTISALLGYEFNFETAPRFVSIGRSTRTTRGRSRNYTWKRYGQRNHREIVEEANWEPGATNHYLY